ncbi:DEAD/DEAH box helicase [Candidatus Gracilibacteria bacterium]|nr:DEAD/DEAH box helicase [Candidatus Gracilibacteria bacterium]
MLILTQNTTYINSGNSFSRAFLVHENLENKNLVVFDSSEDLRVFGKIWEFLGFGGYFVVEKLGDFMEFLNSGEGVFFGCKDIFELPFVSEYELSKNTISIVKNEVQNSEEIIKKLLDFGYKYSSHLGKSGSYNKEGDTLNIYPKMGNYGVKISFFGDEIDDILLLDFSNSRIIKKLDEFKIINSAYSVEENKNTIINNLNKYAKFFTKTPLSTSGEGQRVRSIFGDKSGVRAFIIGLDFFDGISILQKNLNPIILAETPQESATNLEINPFSVNTIGELIDILKSKNQVKIYTKNEKTITKFLEFNDITRNIEIIEIPASMRYLESFKINSSDSVILSEEEQSIAEGSGVEGSINNNLPYKENIIGIDFSTSSKGQKKGLEGQIIYYICDDILSDIFIKKRSKKSLAKSLDLLLEIRPGDFIVHVDHGIGKFIGIILKDLSGIKREYIEIEYRENDKLFVPISELHRISKYIGNENPALTRLSSAEWQKIMKNTEVEVERIATELLEIYAKRNILKGFSFSEFSEKEKIFKDSFPYKHTFDQEVAIKEILSDMEKSKPTDRLLVGDVGFGKTEVAMNAVYRSFLNGKQSAFISPLVILAYEHFESLKKRFADFGLKIEILTRVSTKKEETKILAGLASGEIDVIIGTHRLLSPDINFKNLGLIVIDEEHRFGVMDKEKLNSLKLGTGTSFRVPVPVDILSLSATPIPRSLNFALNGIKDISIISTPPPKKQPIKTIVSKWSDDVILNCIKKEFERDGQVLFIHNRIATIETTKKYLEKLIGKNAKIVIVHGQMNGLEVEDRIMDFKNGKYNILLSTTVIENGVNFFNANTIIIDEADKFGLSQIHQLRGRVGRGATESNCYLIYRKENLADDAKKRLITIVNNTHLGAGFEIAMKDLEIRGAGDILGIKQSGKSKETGLSLYLKLLENKIEELKTGNKIEGINCQIELGISYYISEDFFSSESDKLHFFRNIESIETISDLEFAHKTFIEGNDEVPEEFENLFLILKTRIILSQYGVTSLKKVGTNYTFEFNKSTPADKVKEFLDRFDDDRNFVLITIHKIKVETKFWKGDLEFLRSLVKY